MIWPKDSLVLIQPWHQGVFRPDYPQNFKEGHFLDFAFSTKESFGQNTIAYILVFITCYFFFQGNLLDSDDLLNPKSKEKAVLVAREVIDYKASSGLNITVLGFNCVEPDNILAALEAIRDHQGGQLRAR